MRIKIAKDGSLKMLRKDRFILMTCPFTDKPDYDRNCGDWCPLFEIFKEVRQDEMGMNIHFHELRLCHKTYQIDSLEHED